jgi:hypothetical protein
VVGGCGSWRVQTGVRGGEREQSRGDREGKYWCCRSRQEQRCDGLITPLLLRSPQRCDG